MTLIRRGAVLAAALAIGLGLTACSGGNLTQSGSSGGDSKGTIKLGMLTPLTGSSAAIGPYMQNGAQLAIDEINAQGGVAGR
jgi:branched-chain amino acid transport system substrate-binding protein